jgi:hypothetical protein
MLQGKVPDEAIDLAIRDSYYYLGRYGVEKSDPGYEIKQRLMTCHILNTRGFGKEVLSHAVGDVNISYAPLNQGTKEGMTSYLQEFLKLHTVDPYFTSI